MDQRGGGLLWNLVENGPEDKQRFHLLTWICRRLRRVCRSTFAAETLAAAEAMDELFLLKSLFNDTFGRMKNKNICDFPPTLNTGVIPCTIMLRTVNSPSLRSV